MDIRDLEFDNESFDVLIDKGISYFSIPPSLRVDLSVKV
jgi:hypothetical protein